MLRSKLITAAFAAILLCVAGAASAVTTIVATSIRTAGNQNGFTATYNDMNGDHLMEINELVSFSGYQNDVFYLSSLLNVPDLAGVSQHTVFSQPDFFTLFWNMGQEVDSGLFNYAVNGVPVNPVPEPATYALMLAGLAFIARRASSRR